LIAGWPPPTARWLRWICSRAAVSQLKIPYRAPGAQGYSFNPATGNTATATFSATPVRYLQLTFTANTGWPAGPLSELQVYAS
jgi:hypothetical protein